MAPVPKSPLHAAIEAIWNRDGRGKAGPEEQAARKLLSAGDQAFVREFGRAVRFRKQTGWSPDDGGISSHNLALPDIDRLRKLCQSIATLETIISPAWESRYYSFNCRWSPGTMCASMRNGSGDDYYIHFSAAGALIKGFAHEFAMSPWSRFSRSYHDGEPGLWPGLVDQVSAELGEALREEAFLWEATTFCIWRTYGDDRWRIGDIDFPTCTFYRRHDRVLEVGATPDPDGSNFLLSILDGNPASYKAFADMYYVHEDGESRNFPLPLIEHVFAQSPLSEDLVRGINPTTSLAELAAEIYDEIGYPRETQSID